MSAQQRADGVPRPALIGAGLLISAAIALAALSQFSGIGHFSVPKAEPLASVALRFEDRADGAVTVLKADDDAVVTVLAPETNGFIRGVMRGLARGRKLQEVGAQVPFVLTRWDDGRLSLRDTATGHTVELVSFGPDNLAAFARLLPRSDHTTQAAR